MREEYYWMVFDGGVACGMRTRSYESYRAADVGRGEGDMAESSCGAPSTVKAQQGEFCVSGPGCKRPGRDFDRPCPQVHAGV